jgi:hypothetical protein
VFLILIKSGDYDVSLFYCLVFQFFSFATNTSFANNTSEEVIICVENSCRSQTAEAFAKIHGKEVLDGYSAGSKASGKVNEKAIKSMKEVGYDLGTHQSKSLSLLRLIMKTSQNCIEDVNE